MLIPEKYISKIAKIILIGILHKVMIVGLMPLRKRNRIKIANSAPHNKLLSMELTTSLM